MQPNYIKLYKRKNVYINLQPTKPDYSHNNTNTEKGKRKLQDLNVR
jgi:hypothetical protein